MPVPDGRSLCISVHITLQILGEVTSPVATSQSVSHKINSGCQISNQSHCEIDIDCVMITLNPNNAVCFVCSPVVTYAAISWGNPLSYGSLAGYCLQIQIQKQIQKQIQIQNDAIKCDLRCNIWGQPFELLLLCRMLFGEPLKTPLSQQLLE